MPRGYNNNNSLGINQTSPFGNVPFTVKITNKGIQRLAVKFADEVKRADIPIRTAWLELAADVQIEASKVLKAEVKRHGRPQRDQRGERRWLEFVLDTMPTEELAIIRTHGFQFPNTKAIDASPAGRYWRQIENPDGRVFEMSGLFVLPPIGQGGRVSKGQFQNPGEGRDAVKFQQFAGPRARKIFAHMGPKDGGYHFFQTAKTNSMREWRKGRAKALFIQEFRVHGLNIIERILARRAYDAGAGNKFEQPRFFSE